MKAKNTLQCSDRCDHSIVLTYCLAAQQIYQQVSVQARLSSTWLQHDILAHTDVLDAEATVAALAEPARQAIQDEVDSNNAVAGQEAEVTPVRYCAIQ